MKLCLIFRGLAGGRRESIITEILSKYNIRDSKRIDTPQPKQKLTNEQMRDLAVHSFNEFKGEVSKGTELIIINNANIKHYHYYQYLDYAQRFGYLGAIILVPWNDMSDRELAIDSGNSIPPMTFRNLRRNFEWSDISNVNTYKPSI